MGAHFALRIMAKNDENEGCIMLQSHKKISRNCDAGLQKTSSRDYDAKLVKGAQSHASRYLGHVMLSGRNPNVLSNSHFESQHSAGGALSDVRSQNMVDIDVIRPPHKPTLLQSLFMPSYTMMTSIVDCHE